MTPRYDWVVYGGDVVSGTARVRADVGVSDGLVVEVAPEIDRGRSRDSFDATGLLVLPGIIDAHNHPYYQDDLETFSLSAAYGGVTTLLSFAGRPWGSSDASGDIVGMVDDFIGLGRRVSYLDFGVHVILDSRDDFSEVVPELLDRGITSYKVFMAFPGNRMVTDDLILELMERLQPSGSLCMVHCENGPATAHLERRFRAQDRTTAADWVRSRPPQLEAEAVYRALSLADVASVDCYIVHVSAAESVLIAEEFRRRPGPRRLIETSPHYLTMTHHDQERMGGKAKISPPMREDHDVETMWDCLQRDIIDVVASDCSGQTCHVKERGEPNVFDVAYGIPGVEQLFPVVYDAAVKRGVKAETLVRLFCENPADIFGIADRKGRLELGKDADLVVFDPREQWTVRAADQHGNSDYSLYEGRELVGRAVFSLSRGRPVLRNGVVEIERGSGLYLSRRSGNG